MKTTTFGFLAAALFLFASATVVADGRDYRFEGARDNGGWRLGERVRDGYAIYHRGRRVPGAGIEIGDGWVIGTKRESGGFAIYRWNGRGWDQAPGGAVRIGGTYRQPWVINNRGQRYIWNGYDWDADYGGSRGNAFGHDRWRERGYDKRYDYRHDQRFGRDRYDRDRSDRRRTRW